MSKYLQIIAILFFLTFIGLGPLGLVKGPETDRIYHMERRKVWSWPSILDPNTNVYAYVRTADRFMKERILGRSQFLQAFAASRLAIDYSPFPQDVVVGRDGWFFTGDSHNRTFAYSRHLIDFTEGEINKHLNKWESRQAIFAEKNVPLLITVVPNKSSIYPEKAPAWAKSKRGPSGLSLFDQAAQKTDLPFLDLTQALQKAMKKKAILYYRGDSHWNYYGAFAAFEAMFGYMQKSLDLIGPETLRPIEAEDYIFNNRDLYRICLIPEDSGPEDERAAIIFADVPRSQQVLRQNSNYSIQVPIWQPYYIDREEKLTKFFNKTAPNRQKVLLLADSYSTFLLPYFISLFNEVRIMHFQHLKTDRDLRKLLEEFTPDFVVWELAERAFLP